MFDQNFDKTCEIDILGVPQGSYTLQYLLLNCCTLFLTSSLALLSSASRMARRVSSCWARWLSSAFVLVMEASFSLRERTCCCSSSSRCSNSFLRQEKMDRMVVNKKRGSETCRVVYGTITTTTGAKLNWSAEPQFV